MAGSTPVYALPYQGVNDSPNGPDLGQDLAEAAEAVILARAAEIAALTTKIASLDGGTFPDTIQDTSGTTASGAFTEVLTGGTTCSTTFVAPASGKVDIYNTAQLGNSSSANLSICAVEVKTGAVVGSGTTVLAAATTHGLYCGSTVRATVVTTVSGLTPGATYNVQQKFANTAGTGTFANKRLAVRSAA
jgi:hypothetical protein